MNSYSARVVILSKYLIFIFLILYTAPLFFYESNLDIYSKYYLICTYFSVFIFLLIYKPSIKKNINSLVPSKKMNFNLHLLLIISCYFAIFLFTKEFYISPFNRSTRNSDFIQGNLYVIIDIIIKSIFCKIIYTYFYTDPQINKKKIIIIFIVFAILFDVVYLGARRSSVFILMALFWSLIQFMNTRKYFLILISLVLLGTINFLISGYREIVYAGISNYSLSDIVLVSLNSNEYELVSNNFLSYKDYAKINGYGYGNSIATFPITFIPRFLWSSKPLSIDKTTEIFPNLVGELYYNFGIFSVFFLLCYIWFIIYNLKKHTMISMVLFALIPEFFRTAFSTFIFTIFLYLFFIKLTSIKLKNNEPLHV